MEARERLRALFADAHQRMGEAECVVIVSPVPYDADSLASCRILHQYLTVRYPEKRKILFCKNPITIKSANSLLDLIPTDDFVHTLPDLPPSCVAVVDYGNYRTCELGNQNHGWLSSFVGFDHHDPPADDFPEGGIQVSDIRAAATTEILNYFLAYTDVPLTKELATYVALGIAADTGGRVTAPKMNERALELLALCRRIGIPWEKIQSAMRPRWTPERVSLWGRAVGEIQFDKKNGLASLLIPHWRFTQWGTDRTEAQSLMGLLQDYYSARVAVLVMDRNDGTCDVILRSSAPEDVSASRIARGISNHGGGHGHAARAFWHGSPEQALTRIKEFISRLTVSPAIKDAKESRSHAVRYE